MKIVLWCTLQVSMTSYTYMQYSLWSKRAQTVVSYLWALKCSHITHICDVYFTISGLMRRKTNAITHIFKNNVCAHWFVVVVCRAADIDCLPLSILYSRVECHRINPTVVNNTHKHTKSKHIFTYICACIQLGYA